MKLLAGKPGWTVNADVIVIGSGVAGLTTALNLRSSNLSVLLVTKARIDVAMVHKITVLATTRTAKDVFFIIF